MLLWIMGMPMPQNQEDASIFPCYRICKLNKISKILHQSFRRNGQRYNSMPFLSILPPFCPIPRPGHQFLLFPHGQKDGTAKLLSHSAQSCCIPLNQWCLRLWPWMPLCVYITCYHPMHLSQPETTQHLKKIHNICFSL